jgi:hypothetical protein
MHHFFYSWILKLWCQALEVLAASYSGGRDQEDYSLKPAQANSSQNPVLKKTHHKKVPVEWLKW